MNIFNRQYTAPKSQTRKWYSKSIAERNELNNEAIDKRLIGWDEMLDNIPQRKIKPFHEKTHVVFFHIPKTAGTTMDHVISKNLAVWGMFKHNDGDFDKNIAGFYKMGRAPRTIMGHHELTSYFYQLLERERMVQFTCLREPVARVVSYYVFVKAHKGHPNYKLANQLSLKEFVQSPKSDEIHNAQSMRILGLLNGQAFKKDKRSDADLISDTVNQLKNRYSFFGITEQFDAFLMTLAKLMKWHDNYYQRKNVTNKKIKTSKQDIDSETMDLIKQYNAIDIEVYQQAKELFEQRCKTLHITDQVVRDFQSRNVEFQQLVKANKI